MKIMLIDDDVFALKTLSDTLTERGFSNSAFSNASEAMLALFQSDTFNVVITDFHLPPDTALDVIRSVKQMDRNIFLIVISGEIDADNIISILNAGGNAFFPKPININKFVEKLNEIRELSLAKMKYLVPAYTGCS